VWDKPWDLSILWQELKRVLVPGGVVVSFAAQPFTTDLIASNRAWFRYCWVWEKDRYGDVMNSHHRPLRAHEDIVVFCEYGASTAAMPPMPYHPQGLVPCSKKANGKGSVGSAFHPPRASHHAYVQEWTNYPTTILRFPQERPAPHPTAKPVPLLSYLISTYSLPGDTVFDPGAGSGSTAVACIETGRRFVGCELDEGYYAVARRRVDEAVARIAQQDH
jgi:site-specific DNA-methyltransferase (adenine-specific)